MKKILFILTALLAFVTVGCQEDDLGRDNSLNLQNGFKLSYHIPDPVSVLTKSAVISEKEENQIHSFYILFFENSTDGSGLFIEVLDLHESFGVLGSSGLLDISFPDGSGLDKTKEYKMLFCANIEEYSTQISSLQDIKTLCQGYDEKTVNALLLEISGVEPSDEEEREDQNRMQNTKLPMSATAVKSASASSVSIELTRMVSRFDVFCEVSGYELVSASVWNAAVAAPIWNEYESEFPREHTQRYYGVSATNNQVVASLYAFENSVDVPEQDDRETTCIIVGLRNSQGNIEYFRVNMNPASGDGQLLKRNHAYKTIIRGVMGVGSDSERDAFHSGRSLLDIDINGWFLDESGNVQIHGDHVLAVPTQHIRLYAHGDERSYSIYTVGEGTPELQSSRLPGQITASFLTTTQGDLKRHELILKANQGTTDDGMGPYYVTITYAGMSVDIFITQETSLGAFINLSQSDKIYFSALKLESSEDIVVSSSGKWNAKIYNGGYFSFRPEGYTLQQETNGVTEGRFKIHSIETNSESDSRYSFVVVSLEDMPNVSEVIVLEQFGTSGQYLTVDPVHFPNIPAGGGSTELITVFSTGPWTARLEIEGGGYAYFEKYQEDDDNDEGDDKDGKEDEEEPTGPQEWRGSNGDTFLVTFNGLKALHISPEATITVTLDENPNIKKTFTIKQSPFTEKSIVLQTTSRTKRGSLFDLGRAVTHGYVYNLATNLRNSSLFGPQGKVRIEEPYSFLFASLPNELASIYQITSLPKQKQFNNEIKNWMQNETNRFIFFSTNGSYASTTMTRYQNSSAFGNKGYSVTSVNAKRDLYRKFNPKATAETNKLFAYLLKDGPFTKEDGIELDPANLKFKSRADVNRALTKWPDTFIPIIMAAGTAKNPDSNINYCVFGIDPTNRIIWLSDSGIFGSKTASHSNQLNFPASLDSEEQRFLNNLISWITHAVAMGEVFYKDYQIVK